MPPKLLSLDDPERLQQFVSQAKSRFRSPSFQSAAQNELDPSEGDAQERNGEISQIQPISEQTAVDRVVVHPQALSPEPDPPPPSGQLRRPSPKLSLDVPRDILALTQGLEQVDESSSIYSPRAISDAFQNFVQTMDGVPLNQSIWAPSQQTTGLQQSPPARTFGSTPPSTSLPNGVTIMTTEGVLRSTVVNVATQTDPISPSTWQALAARAQPPPRKDTKDGRLNKHVEPTPKPVQTMHSISPPEAPSGESTLKSKPTFDIILKENVTPATRSDTQDLPPHLRMRTGKKTPCDIKLAPSKRLPGVQLNSADEKPTTNKTGPFKASDALHNLSFEVPVEQRPLSRPLISIPGIETPPEKEEGETSPGIPVSPGLLEAKAMESPPWPNTKRGVDFKPAPLSTEEEDRTNKFWLGSWGSPAKRDGPVPQKRTIILTDLPEYATSSFISSIVYGGNLEQIRLDRFGCKAWIRFLDPAACQKFYENSDNGLVYGKENNGKEKIVWVDLGKDVNVIGGNLREQIARGCTRSVKVVPVEEDFTKMALETFAARGRRSVEGLEEGRSSPNNKRTVIFRFTEIEHAVQFHGTLKSDADWEQCNINYVDDPGKNANGPRV